MSATPSTTCGKDHLAGLLRHLFLPGLPSFQRWSGPTGEAPVRKSYSKGSKPLPEPLRGVVEVDLGLFASFLLIRRTNYVRVAEEEGLAKVVVHHDSAIRLQDL